MLFSSPFFPFQVSSFYFFCLRGIVLLLSSESHPILSSSCSILVNCSSKFLVLEGVGFYPFIWFQLYTFHSFVSEASCCCLFPSSLHLANFMLYSLFLFSTGVLFKFFLVPLAIFHVFATFNVLWSHSFVKKQLSSPLHPFRS